jgi:hypothetical protein
VPFGFHERDFLTGIVNGQKTRFLFATKAQGSKKGTTQSKGHICHTPRIHVLIPSKVLNPQACQGIQPVSSFEETTFEA